MLLTIKALSCQTEIYFLFQRRSTIYLLHMDWLKNKTSLTNVFRWIAGSSWKCTAFGYNANTEKKIQSKCNNFNRFSASILLKRFFFSTSFYYYCFLLLILFLHTSFQFLFWQVLSYLPSLFASGLWHWTGFNVSMLKTLIIQEGNFLFIN